jgi:hypothetical protein
MDMPQYLELGRRTQKESHAVLPSSLSRLSGLALVLAAATFVIAEMLALAILLKTGASYDLKQIAQSGIFILQSFLTLVAGALLLGGMVGFYVRQCEAAGRLGVIGFVLAFFGTVLVAGDFYANTFVTPLVAQEVPEFLDNPLSGFLQVWLPFDFTLLALSWLLLAVATVRARVYPRAAAWFLLASVLVALIPLPLVDMPFDAALLWLGYSVLKVPAAGAGRRPASRRPRSKSRR